MWVWGRSKQESCPIAGGVEQGSPGLPASPCLLGGWISCSAVSSISACVCRAVLLEAQLRAAAASACAAPGSVGLVPLLLLQAGHAWQGCLRHGCCRGSVEWGWTRGAGTGAARDASTAGTLAGDELSRAVSTATLPAACLCSPWGVGEMLPGVCRTGEQQWVGEGVQHPACCCLLLCRQWGPCRWHCLAGPVGRGQ